jgi:hypothetical protein
VHERAMRSRAPRRNGFPRLTHAVLVTMAAMLAALPAVASASPKVRVSLVSKPADPSAVSDASFGWSTSGSVSSTVCTLDGVVSACVSPKSYSGLAAGSHAFSVKVSGTRSSASASYSWQIAAPAPAPAPDPAPAPEPSSALWDGGLEDGTLSQWYAPSTSATGNFGGGEYDSGSGVTNASQTIAHSGAWAQRMTLTNGVGGTRMFRWRELRANRTTRQSTWMYIPRNYTLTGDPATGKYWILYEFKSRTADNTHNDPFWYVNAYNRSDGSLGAKLAWGYQSKLAGPHSGESGWRNYGDVNIPVGRWFKIDSTITQSNAYDGAINITLDNQPLANLTNIRTGWPNCTYNPWCVEQHWAVTNYSDGIAQTPTDIYVDDNQVQQG